MTTGDLKNNLRKFHAELKLINYISELDIEGLSIGRPSAFLPILHFVLTEFSVELAQYFYSKDYELLGKNDKNFLSVIYRILRDEFNSKPPLTKEQFFTLGFAERKLQFVTFVIQLCRKKSDVLKPKKKKNILGLNAAKTSKMNIHIPGRIASTTIGTKNGTAGTTSFQATTSVDMPTESSLASHFTKPGLDNTTASEQPSRSSRSGNSLAYKPDTPLTEGQTLKTDLDLTMPDDGSVTNDQNAAPRPRCIQGPYPTRVERNIACGLALAKPETMTIKNPLLLQKRHCAYKDYISNGKNDHATKENICPNSGNALFDGDKNVDDLRSDQRHSIILSPIPVTNKMTSTGFHPHPEKQVGNDGPRPCSMPFVNYSERPEYSKHIFVTQASEGIKTPLRNEALDISRILDKHPQEYADITDYVKKQDKRIDVLEKEADERNGRIEELVEVNSKLNARVMVLETAVALMQERLES